MKQQDSFLQQFQAARQEVAEMKKWMGESAKLATLTFPAGMPAIKVERRAAAGPKTKR